MPGFDPVRDAVLNSPITRSPTLPRHHPPPSTSAATSPHNAPAPTAHAPRRATVAALLNDMPPARLNLSRPSTSSSTSHRPPSSPAMHRPAIPRARSPTPQRPPSPPPKPKPLPYKPRRRTPAGAEMRFYRTQLGTGTRRLAKRKPPRKKIRDTGLVMDHYNARPDVGIDQRRVSPIIGLRNFNNWIKSVLITRYAHPALASSASRTVLELGCGKGGDLNKWSKARIKEYIAFDIAALSVDQARARWDSLPRASRFDATFTALDCYSEPLIHGVLPARLAEPFDVVSMQFCMHYAFESEAKAHCMLRNVTQWLRPGGIFLGTIPNAEQLLARLDQMPADAPGLSFGNSVYSIKFESRESRPLYGHRYSFFLKDAVEDVPEYLVHWEHFAQLAEKYKLRTLYKKEFHDVFQEFHEHADFRPLLQKMKVVDENGETEMNEDQWEAANIYVAFAMEKY
ncbi:mRNA capping enzyme-domain-containing protein [Russula vinacea]|nr:mRNA capping enzyme-domain-containing protein [Russula vinacea]